MDTEAYRRKPADNVEGHNGEKWKKTESVEVKRTVGLLGGISFIVGYVIGSGIFIAPKGLVQGSGSVGLALISWTMCGLVSITGAFCYAELGTVIPESGGEHAYLMHSFGNLLAFLYGWTCLVLVRPAGLAGGSLICATYIMVPLFGDDCGDPPDSNIRMAAVVIILLLLAINVYSTKLATSIQIIFTVAKVLALCIIIVGGMVAIAQGRTEHLASGFEGTETNIGKIVLGFYHGLSAYEGWNNLNYITKEVQDPNRNLPLSILIAVPMVMVVYVLTNISYFTVMSPDELLASPAVAVTWADEMIPSAAWIIPVFVAMSTFGGSNGNVFSMSRLMAVTAKESHIPKVLAMVHVDSTTPTPALVVFTAIAIVVSQFGEVLTLIESIQFVMFIFYGIVMVALIYLRKKLPDAERTIKVPLVIPIFFGCVSAFLVFIPLIFQPSMRFLWSTLIMFSGLLFYVPFVHFRLVIPGMDRFTSVVQLAFNVLLPASVADYLETKDQHRSSKAKMQY